MLHQVEDPGMVIATKVNTERVYYNYDGNLRPSSLSRSR